MKNESRFVIACVALCLVAVTASANIGAKVTDKFKEMDTNEDNQVSAAEHETGADNMFKQIDANDDGNVTAAELDIFHAKKKETYQGKGAKKGKMSTAEKIAEIDANSDDVISRQEHRAGAHSKFLEMDTDKSGSLNLAEMQAGHKYKMRKKAR